MPLFTSDRAPPAPCVTTGSGRRCPPLLPRQRAVGRHNCPVRNMTMTTINPAATAAGHGGPGLTEVRARRTEIASLRAALQIEDRELANAEATLLRLAYMIKVAPA